MLIQPLSHSRHSAFVCFGRWMRSVEDAHFIEENDRHAASFALADLRTQADEKRFNVFPGDVRAGWACEDGFQGFLMNALHL